MWSICLTFVSLTSFKYQFSNLTNWSFFFLCPHRSEYRPLLGSSISPLFRFKTNLAPLSVVSHPSVRVVLCACGAGVALEALLYGKPLLCLPALADQLDVAARVVDAGAGMRVYMRSVRGRVGGATRIALNKIVFV